MIQRDPAAPIIDADGVAEQTAASGHPARAAGHGIAPRLLTLVLAFSVVVTLALAAVQLYLDYRSQIAAVDARLDEIERSYGSSLGAGLWNLDEAQLELQLQGILRLPDIRAVELRETILGVQKPLHVTAGQRGAGAIMSREYPLMYDHRGEQRRVGTLYVEASLHDVHQRLRAHAESLLLSQAIETFLVALFLLYLVHRLVTRHLIAIAGFVSRFDVHRANRPLQLQRDRPMDDELDRVVEAFNQMSVYLHRAWSDLERANRELEHDLHLRRGYEQRLHHQAHFDTLTGLANRVLLLNRLRYAVRHAERSGVCGALLCIDLDQFKNVNDTAGHAVGDELLKEAARRLGQCVRERDTLARMGGDEFAVVITEGEREAADRLAERVIAAFARPFSIAGIDHYVTASIGSTLFPADGADPQRLLRNADLAMYKAKQAGRNRHRRFLEAYNQALSEELSLETRLRGAVERQELELHYQPIVALGSERVVAREALLRWRMDDGTLCMPDRFIPKAEDMGLIVEFGRWVLQTACADLAAEPDTRLRVAVNVSPRQLQEVGLADFIAEQLRANRLPPERLELEITERVVMDDTPTTEANLKLLCALGVRLSIDDFGTGYSSLGYLQKYPFQTLKIDRSFVTAALSRAHAAQLVETIVAMAHGLGLEVIAEGVETPEQRTFLLAAGSDLGQGYLFGRPKPRRAD